MRGFRIPGDDPNKSPIFLDTPRRVTQTMTDLVMPNETTVASLLEEISPHKSKLVSLFHQFISPCYPVMKVSTQYSPSMLPAIYALALPWRSHDPTLPWAQFDSKGVTRLNVPEVNILWQHVWQQISRELHAPSYSTLQACLLLIERDRPKPFVADTPFDWALVGVAVSLAYTLGLHLDSSSWQIGQQERSQREVLWWMTYTQERWIATIMGRPLLIRDDDFTVSRPNCEAINSNSIVSGDRESLEMPFYHHLTSLTFLLDKIYFGFMSIKQEAWLRSDIPRAVASSNKIHGEVREWSVMALSDASQVSQTSSEMSPPIGALLIASIYCHILLYRFILKLTIRTPYFAVSFDDALKFGQEIRKRLLECLTLVQLESFWFSWSRAQFNAIADFMALLCVIAPSHEDQQRARSIATAHRQWLWLRSKSFEISRPSMVRLDSLLSSIDKGDLSMDA
ncbi:hypothetical protein EG329_001287 [Mollisiaceae sp. DMI_Dod_QoI]|nr:hypothetical protein EG329_001287 [Helotiales sp. DMI_Dod_QoI]